MKRSILFFFCSVLLAGSLQAQTFIGYTYNNFESAAGVMFNPASMAGSNFLVDVNLISANAAVGTNAYKFDRSSFRRFNFIDAKMGIDFHRVDSNDPKSLWLNADVLGPSVVFSLTPKHSIALTSRFRFLANEENLSNEIFQLIGGDSNGVYGIQHSQSDMRMNMHAFSDFGLSYAAVVYEDVKHKVKFGVTGKYVLGLASGIFTIDELDVFLSSPNTLDRMQGRLGFSYSKGIDAIVKQDVGRVTDYIDSRGFGFDIGAVYEWTPNETRKKVEGGEWFQQTTYKLRAAVSLTDVGRLKYDTSPLSATYNVKILTPINADFINIREDESLDEYINRMLGAAFYEELAPKDLRTSLPTLLRTNVDWQAWKRLYVNVDGSFNLVGKRTVGGRYISAVAITPRYESRWFSAYSPVSYNAKKNLTWGIGFNFGCFFIGSGSLLSNLLTNNIQNIDAHAGLHVPIFRPNKNRPSKKPVVVEQPIQYVQPIREEPLVEEVQEVQIYVPKVIDVNPNDHVVIPEYEVDEEIAREVELLGRSIYFVTGSDWLLIESREPLNKIAAILDEHPEIKVEIQGYTDSVGTTQRNMVLSQQRADSVKRYLVEKNIDPDRIATVGMGPEPFAYNGTSAGRAKNRRVEITLRY